MKRYIVFYCFSLVACGEANAPSGATNIVPVTPTATVGASNTPICDGLNLACAKDPDGICQTIDELPECTSENEGSLYYVRNIKKFYECNTNQWYFIDLKGEKGDTGAVGPKGDKGDRGIDGANGIDGSVGPQGERGEKGDKGDQGDVGPQGATGAVGATGSQGAQGERGEKGDKGDQGLPGTAGYMYAYSSVSRSIVGNVFISMNPETGQPVVYLKTIWDKLSVLGTNGQTTSPITTDSITFKPSGCYFANNDPYCYTIEKPIKGVVFAIANPDWSLTSVNVPAFNFFETTGDEQLSSSKIFNTYQDPQGFLSNPTLQGNLYKITNAYNPPFVVYDGNNAPSAEYPFTFQFSAAP